jgi:RimJ/RimL family protein N-acetyltransferase
MQTRDRADRGHIVCVQPFLGCLYGGRVNVELPSQPLSDGVVTLRPWRPDDAEAIAAAFADRESLYWMHQVPDPYTESEALEYVRAMGTAWRARRGGAFAVVEEATGAVAGSVGLNVVDAELAIVEVGYWAAPAVRGRGLTTRALRLLARWLLVTAGAARVQLRADVQNAASVRVAEKAGFTREGVLRSSGYNHRAGRRIDYAMFSLLPGEES